MRLNFRIKGTVKEEESNLPLSNLIIRAYDKDLIYDDLLGETKTNAKGEFEINYSENDFKELFDKKPDIYLSIFDPMLQIIFNTKDSVKWNVLDEELFEIIISKKKLGNFSPSGQTEGVSGNLKLKI